MKKITFINLLVLLFSFSINSSFAQKHTETAYEKKVNEIKSRYVKEIIQIKLAGGRPSDFKFLENRMKKELKSAERLKTTVDFQRERQKKLEEEQKQAKEKYEQSDLGIIIKEVKYSFEKWAQKGEFEKQEDFYNRLKNQSKEKFQFFCVSEIEKKVEYWSGSGDIFSYNSEKEFFPMSFEAGNQKWETNVNVPIDEAKNFKNNWGWDIDNFGIVNNNLFPTIILLEYRGKVYKKLTVTLKGLTDIRIPFDKLGINNEFLNGYIFNYAIDKKEVEKRKEQKKEEQRIVYNKKLVSTLNAYNEELLKNPRNGRKHQIAKIQEIPKEEKYIEEAFRKKLRELNSKKGDALRTIENAFIDDQLNYEWRFNSPKEFMEAYKKGIPALKDILKKKKRNK